MFARGVSLRVCDTCHTQVHPFRRDPSTLSFFPVLPFQVFSTCPSLPHRHTPCVFKHFQPISTQFHPFPLFMLGHSGVLFELSGRLPQVPLRRICNAVFSSSQGKGTAWVYLYSTAVPSSRNQLCRIRESNRMHVHVSAGGRKKRGYRQSGSGPSHARR